MAEADRKFAEKLADRERRGYKDDDFERLLPSEQVEVMAGRDIRDFFDSRGNSVNATKPGILMRVIPHTVFDSYFSRICLYFLENLVSYSFRTFSLYFYSFRKIDPQGDHRGLKERVSSDAQWPAAGCGSSPNVRRDWLLAPKWEHLFTNLVTLTVKEGRFSRPLTRTPHPP